MFHLVCPGGVVTDQAEADPETSMEDRGKMGVGKGST